MLWMLLLAALAPDDWLQFRGPDAAGVADDARLPERWSQTENVAWKIDIPGLGWSSPVVWGDRIFVTSGRIFALSDDGVTFVIQAGPEYRLLGTNSLDEMTLATPAIARGSLFIRTASRLYGIRETSQGPSKSRQGP